MILLLDNYDSFTYNLVHYLLECGAEVEVKRNDALSIPDILAMKPAGVVISPGPGTPEESGVCLPLLQAAPLPFPVLGVCLGHQSLGQAFGGKVVRAETPMHGKVSAIRHTGKSVFAGLPTPFNATRYHSLIVERASLPDCLEITAEIDGGRDDGMIMGLKHKEYPLHGVQFHPESIASEHGHAMLANFIALCR